MSPRPDPETAAADQRLAALKAPDLAQFERIAAEAYAGLPEAFRALCKDLVIQIDDFPTDEVVDDMGLEDAFELLGLFQGVGVPFRTSQDSGVMPNLVWLYRRPILDYWAEHDETLGAVIAHVLIHEIGHHFGLSDEDIEAIERRGEKE